MRILFCGQSGYPNNKNATMNRYVSIAKAMAPNNEIIFLNSIPVHQEGFSFEGSEFDYIDVSGKKIRSKNFFKRNLIKVVSPILVLVTLLKLNKEKKIDWVNVYTEYFGICLYYFFLAKYFKFKTILHYVEIRSEFKGRNILMRFNDFLYDAYAMFLFDGYIPISHLLENHLKTKNSNVKSITIPPICDFEYFKKINSLNESKDKYFLYCASVAYKDVIIFVIKSFLMANKSKDFILYLVINGEIPKEISNLLSKFSGQVKIFTQLEYDKLISFYKNSVALLIPIRNIKQDEARFPQKICEYLASEKAIISTNFGEIKWFFKDMENALVCEEYSISSYSKKIEWAMSNDLQMHCIQKNSYEIGRKYFDIKAYEISINDFLCQ